MNTQELIEEVLKIVSSAGFNDDDALRYLNRGQLAIANDLLLPGLSDGYDTVSSMVDGWSVALPSDYHKGLFIAQVDDDQVAVYKDILSLSAEYGNMTTTAGSIIAVAINAGNLVYQRIPEVVTSIDLFYYRKPVDMLDKKTSSPDGLSDVDAYDDALLYFCGLKLQESIEQGMDGVMFNKVYNKKGFGEMVGKVGLHCVREGINIAATSNNKTW